MKNKKIDKRGNPLKELYGSAKRNKKKTNKSTEKILKEVREGLESKWI